MNSDFILKSTGVPTIMYRKNSDGIYATVTGLSKWWPLHVSSQRVNINGWWFTELARLRIVEKGKLQETINYVKWLLELRLYGLLLARICRFVWRNTFLKLRNFFRQHGFKNGYACLNFLKRYQKFKNSLQDFSPTAQHQQVS